MNAWIKWTLIIIGAIIAFGAVMYFTAKATVEVLIDCLLAIFGFGTKSKRQRR